MRLHRSDIVGDVLGGATSFHAALGAFAEAGSGVLVYLRDGAAGVPLKQDERARSRRARSIGSTSVSARRILRDLGATRIRTLASRELNYVGLRGFGIEIEFERARWPDGDVTGPRMIDRDRPSALRLFFVWRGSIVAHILPQIFGFALYAAASWPPCGARARSLGGRRRALRARRHHAFDLPQLPQQRRLRSLVGGAPSLGSARRRIRGHCRGRPRRCCRTRRCGDGSCSATSASATCCGASSATSTCASRPSALLWDSGHPRTRPSAGWGASSREARRSGELDPLGHRILEERLTVLTAIETGCERIAEHAASLRLHAASSSHGLSRLPAASLRPRRDRRLGDAAVHGADRLHLLRARPALGGARGSRSAPRRTTSRSTASAGPARSRCSRRSASPRRTRWRRADYLPIARRRLSQGTRRAGAIPRTELPTRTSPQVESRGLSTSSLAPEARRLSRSTPGSRPELVAASRGGPPQRRNRLVMVPSQISPRVFKNSHSSTPAGKAARARS